MWQGGEVGNQSDGSTISRSRCVDRLNQQAKVAIRAVMSFTPLSAVKRISGLFERRNSSIEATGRSAGNCGGNYCLSYCRRKQSSVEIPTIDKRHYAPRNGSCSPKPATGYHFRRGQCNVGRHLAGEHRLQYQRGVANRAVTADWRTNVEICTMLLLPR